MDMAKPKEEVNEQPLALEEIQRRQASLNLQLAETQLETAQYELEEAKDRNKRRAATIQLKERTKTQKQNALKGKRRNQTNTIKLCRHKMGGKPDNPLKGDGKTCLKLTRLPDGKTKLIQCGRCPLQIATPHRNLKKRNPKLYALRETEFKALEEAFDEGGLDPIKTSPFSFYTEDETPIIPEPQIEYRGNHPEPEVVKAA